MPYDPSGRYAIGPQQTFSLVGDDLTLAPDNVSDGRLTGALEPADPTQPERWVRVGGSPYPDGIDRLYARLFFNPTGDLCGQWLYHTAAGWGLSLSQTLYPAGRLAAVTTLDAVEGPGTGFTLGIGPEVHSPDPPFTPHGFLLEAWSLQRNGVQDYAFQRQNPQVGECYVDPPAAVPISDLLPAVRVLTLRRNPAGYTQALVYASTNQVYVQPFTAVPAPSGTDPACAPLGAVHALSLLSEVAPGSLTTLVAQEVGVEIDAIGSAFAVAFQASRSDATVGVWVHLCVFRGSTLAEAAVAVPSAGMPLWILLGFAQSIPGGYNGGISLGLAVSPSGGMDQIWDRLWEYTNGSVTFLPGENLVELQDLVANHQGPLERLERSLPAVPLSFNDAAYQGAVPFWNNEPDRGYLGLLSTPAYDAQESRPAEYLNLAAGERALALLPTAHNRVMIPVATPAGVELREYEWTTPGSPPTPPDPGPWNSTPERFLLPDWFPHDGLNHFLLQTLWDALQDTDPEGALGMFDLNRAGGRWLEAHGALYGVPRAPGEPDSPYRTRILAEVRSLRGTPEALRSTLEAALPGVSATVWDWTQVPSYEQPLIRYDGSRAYDGSFTYGSYNFLGNFAYIFARFAVDLAGGSVDLALAQAIVERLRHAGMIPSYRVNGIPQGPVITNDTTPPSVSLTASSNLFTAPGSGVLSATASDDVGVVRVEFYRESSFIASDSSAPYAVSVPFTSADNGTWNFFAKAYDAAGNVGTSAPVTLTINIPGPPPPPAPSGEKVIWYAAQPRESMYTDQLTPARIAAINASPYDGVALLVRGVSWECLRSGYSTTYAAVRAQMDLAAGITKKKALLILTSWPAAPSNAAAWASVIAAHGLIAQAAHDAGWEAIFHDNEPYQDSNGNPLPGPNYYDYGWWFIYNTQPAELAALFDRYRALANIVAANAPGIGYGWYHGPYVGLPAAPGGQVPGSVDWGQAGHGFKGAAWAFAGMVEAIVSDGANLYLHDMGESYDGSGAQFYQNSADWRKNQAGPALTMLSPAAQAAYSSTVQIGFGRMVGHATTSSRSGRFQELSDMWPALTARGWSWLYEETNFFNPNYEVTLGTADFQAVRP